MVKLTVTVPIPPCHPNCFQIKFNVPRAPITLSYFLREGVITLPGSHHSEAPGVSAQCVYSCFLRKKKYLEK